MTRRTLESKEHTYITADIRNVTAKAVLIFDGAKEVWIPLSQIEDPVTFNRGEIGVEIMMTTWIAKEKGLI